MKVLFRLKLVLEGKIGEKVPESSRSDLLQKYLVNNLLLSDAEINAFCLLNRGGMADLSLLRTLLEISQSPFVLVVYASLAASRTLSQWLLACLNFALDTEELFCWYN